MLASCTDVADACESFFNNAGAGFLVTGAVLAKDLKMDEAEALLGAGLEVFVVAALGRSVAVFCAEADIGVSFEIDFSVASFGTGAALIVGLAAGAAIGAGGPLVVLRRTPLFCIVPYAFHDVNGSSPA
jgi:hypothetical protein